MAFIKATIDGEVVLDGDTGTWEERPPEFIAQQLSEMGTTSRPSPWMRALMLTVAEAAMTETYTSVDINTSGSGWSMKVGYAIELGS